MTKPATQPKPAKKQKVETCFCLTCKRSKPLKGSREYRGGHICGDCSGKLQ